MDVLECSQFVIGAQAVGVQGTSRTVRGFKIPAEHSPETSPIIIIYYFNWPFDTIMKTLPSQDQAYACEI